ncbi:MAG: BNR-4 repeat-containing protein [Bryobacterales bacterium]|nr:BNR repeat-containing protein [Bryobacteraceae bacterium]MDW8131037.1 BNR-4 repeat-containing protein [Bryobacterales bacterium]
MRIGALLLLCPLAAPALAASEPIVFNDDGGWCWFQDERVLIHGGFLAIGSVAAGVHDPARRGDVEVAVYELASGRRTLCELHDRFERDDHDAPALWVRPDGRWLAVYARHGSENRFYYRLSLRPGDPTEWEPARQFAPSETSRITYSNLCYLAGERRLYNFFRGLDDSFKPSYAYSDDLGDSWVRGNVLIQVPGAFRHRPYARYVSDGKDTIHILYTEGHPRDYDNSAYHVYYRRGSLYRSDGTRIGALTEGLKHPAEGTRIFAGNPDNVAWVSDIHLDAEGRPYVAYSVQKGGAGLPEKEHGHDHRYRYARWDGSRWRDYEIAYAGTRLYPGENDYTGNIALDPADPNTVYISTNADPLTGKPLISRRDGRRHWEIFRGRTHDGGKTWRWEAITRDSLSDNIRPVVPAPAGGYGAVLWLRGHYRSYTDYDLDVVGLVWRR